ncbi:MAG: AAA family ATPase [Myxococcales bacterium]|nr:AAA family ATPase [Myxococcales bacterium]
MSTACGDELQLLIRSGWNLIALESSEEDRALGLLRRVAQATERRLITWTLASGFDAREIDSSLKDRKAKLADGSNSGSLDEGVIGISTIEEPAVFVILDAHRLLDDPMAIRRLRDRLPQIAARRQVVVLLGPVLHLPIELLREAATVELPLPNEAELLSLFERLHEKQADDRSKQDGSRSQILNAAARSALGLTGSEAVRVFRKACAKTRGLNDDAIEEIVREKRRALGRTPALSFHQFDAGLSDVGGLGELKLWLQERRRAFGSEAQSFGLPTPRGLLLLGVQGCGKSLCAKAVAREWHFPLLRLDLAATFSSGTQSPEQAIREAVLVAESLAPAVLWIDEIEKGFAASESDPSASRVFGSFLTWLSEKDSPVFVVATANDVTALPPELLRRGRFDDLFFVDLPTENERAEILSIHLRRRGRDPLQFKLAELADLAARLSGAELEQVVTAALYAAFAESRDLSEADLVNAIHDTVPLYDTYEERIKELRDWAKGRTRPASVDAKMVELFAER